nr:hypothetical protein [Tanacetum cinerariifolium]
MVEKYVVNNKGKGTGQREVRPVWNNARRLNYQNFSKMTHPHPKRNFVPTSVATKSRQVLVNAAKQNSAASTSTARPKVNTAAIRPNVKKVDDEVRIQALVDGKRVNIKGSSIRRTLRLDDVEGTSCLTNAEIFKGLARMGAKTTSWNEFSSTMASTIICLATNQKFNFSRYILLSLVKNIEASVPFFMFPREVTPLFANMLVQAPEKVAEHVVPLPLPSHDLLPNGEGSLKLQELMDLCANLSNKVLDLESEVLDIKSTYKARIEKLENRVERLEEENRVLKELKSVHFKFDSDEHVMEMEKSSKQGRKIADIDADVEINLEKAQAEAYNLELDHQEKVLSMMDVNNEEPVDVEEVLEVVKAAKLITEVVTTAGVDVNAASIQDTPITAAEVTKQVQRRKKLIDAVIKYQDLKRKPLTEAQARRNMIVYLKNMAGYKMDYFKGMNYDEIRPLFDKHYTYNQAFLNEVNEGVKVPKKEVSQEKEVKVESSKREGKSLEQEITKKQKIEQETKELKKHLQIVLDDDDDDVYTDVTPLASKILIINYKIHTERNRPHFKIIRVDGNHMLFLSFSTMLKNFDREDLESLWNIISKRFAKTEPKNYSDDFLLNTLKIMFEKPNVEANIFLLVERMYPLTHFTLDQMMNDVRLEVEDESKMSLELLRLVRRQLNEGTSIPEVKKEEQEQEVVLSQPSSSATTTVVVANGNPPFRKAKRLFLVYRSTLIKGMCTSNNNKMEP